jgi:hypothetical protein
MTKNGCTGYETLHGNGMVGVQLAKETPRELEVDNELE